MHKSVDTIMPVLTFISHRGGKEEGKRERGTLKLRLRLYSLYCVRKCFVRKEFCACTNTKQCKIIINLKEGKEKWIEKTNNLLKIINKSVTLISE